ncbi:hypothetical protein LENED_012416 [Lentinula edodes]|uniref:Uncharacterized protein n=1 Tax=Lentinula edodes TaxID=5353 RepID=A0A1Q3ESM0_LENED|nr:hypothetical protein LENED_012416 [Lentinula edodes]
MAIEATDIVPLSLRFELLDAIAARLPSLDGSIHPSSHSSSEYSRVGVYYSTRNTTILGIFGIPSLPLFVRIFLLPTGLYMHPMMMMAAKADLWHSVLERFGCVGDMRGIDVERAYVESSIPLC